VDYSQISVSGNTVSLKKEGAGVDLGGIAKGFAADEIARVLKENGVTSAVLSLGGNVGVIGEKPDGSPWGVGIRDPHGTANEYVGILKLRDTFAVTSGGYERSFEQDGVTYHHIFDPKTGYPANNGLISVTIVSNDSTYADSLSTALYVMGYDKAMAFYEQYKDFEAVFITDQNLIRCTPGIASDFILTKSDSYHLG
jgi:thiamine biosynthesis lipoprotein